MIKTDQLAYKSGDAGMKYTCVITIQKTHTSSNPAQGSITIPSGIINNARIYFAPGVNGCNRVRVKLNGTQIFPVDPNQSYVLMTSPIEISDVYPNYNNNANITVEGWAENANYPHRVMFACDVTPFDRPEAV